LVPVVGLFGKPDPDMPSVAPPVAAVPQGRPLALIWRELPGGTVLPCSPGVVDAPGLVAPGLVGAALVVPIGKVVVLVAPPPQPFRGSVRRCEIFRRRIY
jgi:hypothetical protein